MGGLDDVFVVDGVSHAYNLSPANYRVPDQAEPIAEGFADGLARTVPRDYRRTRETLLRDWRIEETANLLFRESRTDFTVFHPQSITVFEDGLTAVEKAAAFAERYPTRAAALASVDVLGSTDPLAELTRQVEAFDPHGVKVYPTYWDDDHDHRSVRMDDQAAAFPLWEHAVDLGLVVVAVHKAIPLGDVPVEPYRVEDVEDAAACFPELTFEIVHGGRLFAEETGWQVAANPNVYVNLELTNVEVAVAPERFVETVERLCWAGGRDAIDRLIWGSGAPHYHPRMLLEAFWELDFPELSARDGRYTITQADKRKMLGANLAAAHGLDLDALERRTAGDEFSDAELVTDPYATTDFEVVPS